MGKNRLNIVIADGPAEEMEPFINEINKSKQDGFILKIHRADWQRINKWSETRRYFKYFAVPFEYFFRRKKYSVIVGWQQFYALIYCFYCSLFHVRKQNTVVAWNYTYKKKKGKFEKIYQWFMAKCMDPEYLDYIHVPSIENAELVSREFSFPRDRIIVTPFGVKDEYEKYHSCRCPEGVKADGYFLAIGRSNRDYDFLIRAWHEMDFPLIIISDIYKRKTAHNNITIRNDISGEAQYPWIANCRGVIIPIADSTICSGDTVLLHAMSLKKIVVVTAPSTLAEMYVKDKKNGLAVTKDIREFRIMIQEILKGKYDHITENARESFLRNFSRENMARVLADTLAEE